MFTLLSRTVLCLVQSVTDKQSKDTFPSGSTYFQMKTWRLNPPKWKLNSQRFHPPLFNQHPCPPVPSACSIGTMRVHSDPWRKQSEIDTTNLMKWGRLNSFTTYGCTKTSSTQNDWQTLTLHGNHSDTAVLPKPLKKTLQSPTTSLQKVIANLEKPKKINVTKVEEN